MTALHLGLLVGGAINIYALLGALLYSSLKGDLSEEQAFVMAIVWPLSIPAIAGIYLIGASWGLGVRLHRWLTEPKTQTLPASWVHKESERPVNWAKYPEDR
jgi:MFS-type transporter involved in bile tolerance (Atg22 family)